MINYTKNHLALGNLPRLSGRTRAAEHNFAVTSAKRWPIASLVVLAAMVAHVEAAMNLPDGIENILGFVPRSSFKCERDGYFGDIDNDCRLFHLCQRQVGTNGRIEWRHWTYACGNQTMFNQLTLTCAFVDEAIPCRHASQFQYLNEVIHKPAEPFLTDADVTSGFSYYSNRVMSDGARQRAFHDSQLLAQIGGQGAQANPQQQQAATSNNPTFAQQQSPSLDDQFRQQASFAARLPDHNHHQQRQLTAASLPQQQHPNIQNQVKLIENHSFQLHHQQEDPFQSQAQFQTQFQSQFQPLDNNHNNNFASFHQQQPRQTAGIASASSSQRQAFSAPPPTTTTTPTATTTTTQAQNLNSQDNNINLQGQQSPAQQQNSQFEFSITTSHQANAPSEPATVLVRQQQPFEFKFGPPQTQSPPQVPTTTNTTESSSLLSNNWTVQPTQQSDGAATRTVPSATLVPTFTSSQSLQLAQPTQATVALQSQAQTTTESSTTTTTTTTTMSNTLPTIATTPRASTITRTPEVTSRQARRLVSAGSQAGRRGEQVGIERAHVGFQSTRLSSQKKRQTAANETPIVMRKNPKPDGAPSSTNFNKFRSGLGSSMSFSSSASLAPIEAGAQVPWSTGGDFWQRSFDSQLMAPKFESLPLRSRV